MAYVTVFDHFLDCHGECEALSNQIVLAAASRGIQITADSLMQPPSVGNSTQLMLQTTEGPGRIRFLQHEKNNLTLTLQAYKDMPRDDHPTAAPAQH